MATDENLELALQILQEDLVELEGRQKGKQRDGEHTDLELSITTMREDVLALQTSIRDRAMAVSASAAVISDQHILQSIRRDEAVAEQDRGYAHALQNNQRHTPATSNASGTLVQEDDFGDSISTVMGDLMDRMTLTSQSDNGEGSSRWVSPSQPRMCCISCWEYFDKTDVFTNPCGENLCHECTRQLFLGSIRDEELYPPRCCGRIIPPETALRILDYHELSEFSHRAIEYSAKDRVYCAEPTCSKFIPPAAIRADHGTCPECHRRTHIPCRSLAHPTVDCPLDQPLQDVLALAEMENWRRCSNCRTMVELRYGCHHITCRCGREFCYVCGQQWRTCQCPLWQERRLYAIANEAVAGEVAPNANAVVRRNAFNRILGELERHEDVGCEHHRRSQWRWQEHGDLQCEVCDHFLPEYIFVCRNCRMRACYRCRRHRLR